MRLEFLIPVEEDGRARRLTHCARARPIGGRVMVMRVFVACVVGVIVAGHVSSPVAAATGPGVSSVTPGSGRTAAGSPVTVLGSGFVDVTGIDFGTVAGTSGSVISGTKLTVIAPTHAAGLVDVRVRAIDGTSPISSLDRYTFLPPPAVTTVLPAAGSLRGGTRLTVTGLGFTSSSEVLFGATPGTDVEVSADGSLTVTSPPHTPGVVDLKVHTAGGTSNGWAGDRYTFSTLTPRQASVPADSIGLFAGLRGLTCPVAGWCLASGAYFDVAGNTPADLQILSDGRWTATKAPLPAGTDPIHSKYYGFPGTSCPAPGVCVAAGSYSGDNGPSTPLVETLSGGAWTPVVPPTPADEDHTSGSRGAYLNAVACATRRWCVAVGDYARSDGSTAGLIETYSGGVWTATALTAPASTGGNAVDLESIACPVVRGCVAAGSYTDSSNTQWGLTAKLTENRWATQLPTGETADSSLNAVACPTIAWCAAVGGGQADTMTGNSWTAASVRLGPDARGGANLVSLSCPAVGWCAAAGQYLSKSVSPDIGGTRAVVAKLVDGAWSDVSADVPYGSYLASVACAAQDACVAVGEQDFPVDHRYGYPDGHPTEGLVETSSSGVWTYSDAPVPPDANTQFGETTLTRVSCPSGRCVAVGDYVISDDEPGLIERWNLPH